MRKFASPSLISFPIDKKKTQEHIIQEPNSRARDAMYTPFSSTTLSQSTTLKLHARELMFPSSLFITHDMLD